MELFKDFKVEVVEGSVKRIQMSDEVYFGPEYKDYVSNSKMGLLNPSQGGSPQKFFQGFKPINSTSLVLGSAVHQLTLESEDYALSDITKPGGKLGDAYKYFMEYRNKGETIEKSLVLACNKAEYYISRLKSYNGKTLPGFIKDGIVKCLPHFKNSKTKKDDKGRSLIYLPSDMLDKCKGCVKSLKENEDIQKQLRVPLSFCEDVIICEMRITFPKDFSNPQGERHETIVKLKMKADQWNINHDEKWFTLNDVKTTGKPLQYFMGFEYEEENLLGKVTRFKEGSFQSFHYSRQMAMYLLMLKLYIEQEYGKGYKMSTNMLVVETVGAHNSCLYPVNNTTIKAGFKEFSELLKRVAYHQVKGYESILELEDPNNSLLLQDL